LRPEQYAVNEAEAQKSQRAGRAADEHTPQSESWSGDSGVSFAGLPLPFPFAIRTQRTRK